MPTLRNLIDRYYIRKPRLREAVTRALYRDRDEDVALFYRSVRVNTIKENGYFRAARKANSLSLFRDEAIVLQNLMLFARPRMSFVDVGANVGVFSVMMSTVGHVYPDFDVTAFEVHPDTFARLSVNAQRHGFAAHNVALGARAGSAKFVEGMVSHVTTTVEKTSDYSIPGRNFEMATQRLDSFAFDKPIFLKLDVEGQELDVLEGAKALFDADRVDAVYVDKCPDRAAVAQFLADRGFQLLNGRTLLPSERVTTVMALRKAAYPEARRWIVPPTASAGLN